MLPDSRPELVCVPTMWIEKALLGSWISEPECARAWGEGALVKLRFEPDGTMERVIRRRGGDERELLRYRVEGIQLLLLPEGSPKEEAIPFVLTSQGVLELDLGLQTMRFVRVG